MAATTPVLRGGSVGKVDVQGAVNVLCVPFTMAGPGSYTTGGDAITLPAIKGFKLRAVKIHNPHNAAMTRMCSWDGSVTAPVIRWLTAYPSTQVTAATNLSAETIIGELEYEG